MISSLCGSIKKITDIFNIRLWTVAESRKYVHFNLTQETSKEYLIKLIYIKVIYITNLNFSKAICFEMNF